MISPTGFPSWPSYFKFTMASEFVDTERGTACRVEKNVFERVGRFVSRPILHPLNFLLREFKNPLVIVSLTVSLIAIATLLFYPAEFFGAVCAVLPFLAEVKPWMIKFALFLVAEITIAGIGLRALGRLSNKELRQKWNVREIYPVFIGAQRAEVRR